MKVRMDPEIARLYHSLSPEEKEQFYKSIKANGYSRLTVQDVAEEIGDAMGDALRVIIFSILILGGISLFFGILILTVRMVVENLQVIIKIVGG